MTWTFFFLSKYLLVMASDVNTSSDENFFPLQHFPLARNTKIFSTNDMFVPASKTFDVYSKLYLKHCHLSLVNDLFWDSDPALMRGRAVLAVSTSASTSPLSTSPHSYTCIFSLLPGSNPRHVTVFLYLYRYHFFITLCTLTHIYKFYFIKFFFNSPSPFLH